MSDSPTTLAKHERLRQQRREAQAENASLASTGVKLLDRPLTISHAAASLQQALPPELLREGAIQYDPSGQPKVALYEPRLLAPNPQRGRVVDRNLEELASSLDAHGQQEAIVARLLTPADRERWPSAFAEDQLLVILSGHRLYFAQQRCKRLQKLRVELLMPLQGESPTDYRRRSFTRASVKMMHSQEYTILDKVNLWKFWMTEFALDAPTDMEVSKHFEISRDQARRLRVASQIDDDVAREILNSDRPPADKIVVHIASQPQEEQHKAYAQVGTLTVQEFRQALKTEKPADSRVVAGRPKNYAFRFKDDRFPFTMIGTDRTPRVWKGQGGATAFLRNLKKLLYDSEFKEQLKKELG